MEHEYERKGAWAYLAAWDVRWAEIFGRCEHTTGIAPFGCLVRQVMGVRGRYVKAYRAGTNIVVLADDVASAFPTDIAVNRALRKVMELAEAVPRSRKPSNKALQRTAAKRGHRVIGRQRRGGGR